ACCQAFAERKAALHGGVGIILYLFIYLFPVGVLSQRNAGEFVQCLNLRKGTVEVDNKILFHALFRYGNRPDSDRDRISTANVQILILFFTPLKVNKVYYSHIYEF